MSNTFYEVCVDEGNTEENGGLLECISSKASYAHDDLAYMTKMFFTMFASSLVFFMQAGFAMICTGCVREKNVQNTMLKNLLDACGAVLAFYFAGYGFAYGGNSKGKTFIGSSKFCLTEMDGYGDYSKWIYELTFAATTVTIVAGTLAERCQMRAYLLYSLFLSGFVYPVVVHWVWSDNGYLSNYAEEPLWGVGMVDQAGSGVVHVTGGMTALIASKVLGARAGRFHNEHTGVKLGKPNPMPGHSTSLQMLGTFILWFGWFGFNGGSVVNMKCDFDPRLVETAIINTVLSGASGGLAALVVNLIITEKKTGEAVYGLTYAMNGCISGLVAITAGCSIVEPYAAPIIGSVAGCIYYYCSNLLLKMEIDDAVNAIPCHLSNGIWGVISVGLFASEDKMSRFLGSSHPPHIGWFYSWSRGSSDATLLACQVVGLLFIIGWVTILMLPFFVTLYYFGWLRSDGLEEMVGLDVSYSDSIHRVTANSDIVTSLDNVTSVDNRSDIDNGSTARSKACCDMYILNDPTRGTDGVDRIES